MKKIPKTKNLIEKMNVERQKNNFANHINKIII